MTQTRQPTANKYGGKCSECDQRVEAGAGILGPRSVETGKYTVRHLPARTVGPTGPWDTFEPHTVGGCPKPPVIEMVTYRVTREFIDGALDGLVYTGDVTQVASSPVPYQIGDVVTAGAWTGPGFVIRSIAIVPKESE